MLCLIAKHGRIKAHAIIDYADTIIPVRLEGADRHRTSGFQLHQSMFDGIFHQRLNGQGRQQELTGMQIKSNRHIRKSSLFDIRIVPYMLQFLGKADERRMINLAEIPAKVQAEIVDQLRCPLRLFQAELFNRSQCIIDKMGLDLADHSSNPAFTKLTFFFCQFLLLFCQLPGQFPLKQHIQRNQ